MNIYTRNGDRGTTSLMNGISVSKSDDRIELVGTIDELNSFIGLAKVLADSSLKESLAHIQRNLMQIMAGGFPISFLSGLIVILIGNSGS